MIVIFQMPYYYPIQNEQLRMLVMMSESIHSMPVRDIQKMVAQISNLTEDGQMAMITALEDEQKQIAAARLARGITPEVQMRALQSNTAKVNAIGRDLEMSVRKEDRRRQAAEAEKAAEDILREI